jgi:hypothetical protein
VAESYRRNTQTNIKGSARNIEINIRKQEKVTYIPIKKKLADPRIIISIKTKIKLNKPETYMLCLALYKNIKDLIIKKILRI